MTLFGNERQAALESFLNDKVERLALGLYLWHDTYYEVVPHSLTLKRHNWSGFVRLHHKGKTWMMREATDDNVKKYYPKIWDMMNVRKTAELNDDFISKR